MSRIDKVGLGKQTALGTKNTVADYFTLVESCEPGHNREIIEQEETTGVRHPSGVDYGVEFWTLDVKLATRWSSLGRWLSLWFGQPTTTTPDVTNAPTARNHLFAANAPKEHSLYVVRRDPSPVVTDLFWDGLGDELELSIEPNGFLMLNGKVVCRALDDTQGDPSATLDSTARVSFDQVKVYVSVDGGAEAEVKCRTWSASYKNNIDTDEEVLGQRLLHTLKEGNTDLDVSFEPKDALSTHYRRALQADPAKVKLRMEALGATIGGTTKYKLEQIVYACEYVEAPLPVSAGERLKTVEIKARGRYDEAVSKLQDINLVNIVAAY